MKQFDTFKLNDGREVSIVIPSMDGLKAVTNFVNRLSKEDTFLTFAGENYSIDFEKNWLKNLLNEIKFNKNFVIWAYYDSKIIGSTNVRRGGTRDAHVGKIGLMVDKDFRKMGLGSYLLQQILLESKKLRYKIVDLDIFSDNIAAESLYKKFGFKEYGRLPNGLYRKGKYSDLVKMCKEL